MEEKVVGLIWRRGEVERAPVGVGAKIQEAAAEIFI